MTELAFLAYRYGHSYGGGWSDWIVHNVVSALIHGLIYSVIFRLMRHLSLGEAVVLVVVVIVLLVAWGRSRDGRRW